ncbi:beta-ketoacyl-[acyl-carrier-protein] synthase family protein [Paenibacillus sambharensis]|uniref:Beta-ketoacyl-[acyl-carrier-protein] synthase family protein n=1 Tax=Paenibacillus sambharensis TaxID=1803190 RepID=A0A2W1LUY3_9BACL|nr:beta-ketoacyl-[acyl-carrier-protein] synthase family protein [Paenibacillus sambharensis]PZD95317.1 beta-ketoacyl-[acyl-carrier-protein] synthase family protein [Paenibacillus sambharensis]
MGNYETIVITGVGAVTPVGMTAESTWQALLQGVSGARRIKAFDPSEHTCQIGCEVDEIEHLTLHPAPGGRATRLLLPAVEDALHEARLNMEELVKAERRSGICIGTTMGEISPYEEVMNGRQPGSPGGPGVIVEHMRDYFGFNGRCWTITNACAAGNLAIARAMDELMAGRADVMVAAGVDAMSWVAFTGFASLRAMTPDLCRPFDAERKGLMLGEGSGAIVLERESDARQRGAKPLARLMGYGLSSDAHHITQPDPGAWGSIRAMKRAIEMAGISKESIGYVSAHGTGTPANDRMESVALRSVFNDSIVTSSIKGHIGHTLGAASAIEAVVCVKALASGWLPPTINMRRQDPDCPVRVIANEPLAMHTNCIMSNAYAFGGVNSSIIIGRAEVEGQDEWQNQPGKEEAS